MRTGDLRVAPRWRQRGFFLNPFRFGAPPDPHFANVLLLLRCDGTENTGPATLVDSSSFARTPHISSSGVHRTAQKKWGASSFGRNDQGQLNVMYDNTASVFNMGNTWTLEFWSYCVNINTSFAGWIGHESSVGGNTGRWFMGTDTSDRTKPSYWRNGNPFLTGATGLIVTGVWQFNAISVNAGIAECYISSGGATATRYATGDVGADTATNDKFSVGGIGGVQSLDGYIDDIRLTATVGRHTGTTINVPTGPFPNY